MIPDKNSKAHPGYHILGRPAPLVMIIVYKAAWGLVEIISGVLILFSWRIIFRELNDDPQDQFMTWMLLHMPFGPNQALPLGAAIMTFGLLKLLLAAGLWFRIRLTRQIAIALFSGIAVYGTYEIARAFTPFKAGALALDIAILAYFIFLLPRHLHDTDAV